MSYVFRRATARSLAMAIAAAASVVVPMSAMAHHPGTAGNVGGAGPINTISATTLPHGVTAVAVTYEYTALGGLSDADLIQAGTTKEDAHAIGALESAAATFAYGLTDDVSVSVRLPYVKRRDIREGEHHHDEMHDEQSSEVARRGDTEGFGDASVLGQWRLLNNQQSGTSAALLLGFKAPTGRSDQADAAGERFETEFQAGSGSWDGQFGLALTQRFGAWSLDGNGLYTAVGKGALATDLGDRVHYNAAISYRAMGRFPGARPQPHHDAAAPAHNHVEAAAGPSLDFVLELNGEWHDNEDVSGDTNPNSGGNVVYIAPGVRLAKDAWSGFVSVGVPVINDLNGLQSEPDVRIVSGLALSF